MNLFNQGFTYTECKMHFTCLVLKHAGALRTLYGIGQEENT